MTKRSRRNVRVIAGIGFLCLLALFGMSRDGFCSSSSARAQSDVRALYLRWCSQCHGTEGRGDGVNSTPDMSINPRDHTDRLFMTTRSDAQFRDVIMGGGASVAKSPLMPPWKATLLVEEVDALVDYLRVLCDCEFEGVVSHRKLRTVRPEFR